MIDLAKLWAEICKGYCTIPGDAEGRQEVRIEVGRSVYILPVEANRRSYVAKRRGRMRGDATKAGDMFII